VADEASGSGLVKSLAAVFALFAGLATLIYVGGGTVVALRMTWWRIPNALSVVGQLPKGSLISAGLAQLAFPSLVIAGLYLGGRLVRSNAQRRTLPIGATKQEWSRDNSPFGLGKWWGSRIVFLIVLVLVGGYLIMLPGVVMVLRSAENAEADFWFFSVGPLLAALVLLLSLHTRALLQGQRYKTRRQWNDLRAVGVMAGLYALTLLPGYVLFGSSLPLQRAQICAAGGAYEKEGFLVGESSDRFFLAERVDEPGAARRILTMPLARVEEVFVGGDAWASDCDVVPKT